MSHQSIAWPQWFINSKEDVSDGIFPLYRCFTVLPWYL